MTRVIPERIHGREMTTLKEEQVPKKVYPRNLYPNDDEFCIGCGGEHRPDPADCYIDFRGIRFKPPFYCLCCGIQICAAQFSWGRLCGRCDMGKCNRRHHPATATLEAQDRPALVPIPSE